jgi:hypothetical protein
MAGAVLKSVFDDIESASKAGTLDEVDDMHISRTPLVLDKQGWSDVSDTLKGALERILEIQAETSERLAKSGETGVLAKVNLMHFKSPSSEDSKNEEPETTEPATS